MLTICAVFSQTGRSSGMTGALRAAKTIAPTAPIDAASVGVAMPPRIEPSTAAIRRSGATRTTLKRNMNDWNESILLGKGFVLPSLAKQVEVLGHQRGEFICVAAEIGQQLLNGRSKLCKGRVVGVAHNLLAQELPEPLDQVQIRRVGWQIQQSDA